MRFDRWLIDAFGVRIEGDYGVDALVAAEEARTMIERARELLREAQRIVAGSG